jgi:hypothetical protein
MEGNFKNDKVFGLGCPYYFSYLTELKEDQKAPNKDNDIGGDDSKVQQLEHAFLSLIFLSKYLREIFSATLQLTTRTKPINSSS